MEITGEAVPTRLAPMEDKAAVAGHAKMGMMASQAVRCRVETAAMEATAEMQPSLMVTAGRAAKVGVAAAGPGAMEAREEPAVAVVSLLGLVAKGERAGMAGWDSEGPVVAAAMEEMGAATATAAMEGREGTGVTGLPVTGAMVDPAVAESVRDRAEMAATVERQPVGSRG